MMKYLHTMVRVADVDASIRFYCEGLGLEEVRRSDNEKGRYTLIFLAPPGQPDAQLQEMGVTINRPPRDGNMAFVRSPDGISIEILQDGPALPQQEPWASMPNTGVW
jgi:lactoylglutathione lyase